MYQRAWWSCSYRQPVCHQLRVRRPIAERWEDIRPDRLQTRARYNLHSTIRRLTSSVHSRTSIKNFRLGVVQVRTYCSTKQVSPRDVCARRLHSAVYDVARCLWVCLSHWSCIVTSAPGWVRNIVIFVSVCLSVCSLTCLKRLVESLRRFSVLHVTCGRGSFYLDNSTIRYVLPVLWMQSVTSSHNGTNTDIDHWRIIHRDSPGGAGGEVWCRQLPCWRGRSHRYASNSAAVLSLPGTISDVKPIAGYWSKISSSTYPTCAWWPCWGNPIGILYGGLWRENPTVTRLPCSVNWLMTISSVVKKTIESRYGRTEIRTELLY